MLFLFVEMSARVMEIYEKESSLVGDFTIVRVPHER